MECVYIKEAKYIKDYKVFVKFNTGKSGEIDLKNIIFKYDIANPLRDINKFSRFFLNSWPTLAWDCGFDIAPETLYTKCEPSNAV
jgi:hypothetical protein